MHHRGAGRGQAITADPGRIGPVGLATETVPLFVAVGLGVAAGNDLPAVLPDGVRNECLAPLAAPTFDGSYDPK
jgi:hypothetical protein